MGAPQSHPFPSQKGDPISTTLGQRWPSQPLQKISPLLCGQDLSDPLGTLAGCERLGLGQDSMWIIKGPFSSPDVPAGCRLVPSRGRRPGSGQQCAHSAAGSEAESPTCPVGWTALRQRPPWRAPGSCCRQHQRGGEGVCGRCLPADPTECQPKLTPHLLPALQLWSRWPCSLSQSPTAITHMGLCEAVAGAPEASQPPAEHSAPALLSVLPGEDPSSPVTPPLTATASKEGRARRQIQS